MISDFLKEGPVDQSRSANPTGNGELAPADRARQLGLQSNGKGGYIDPNTGQVVARTVNNELVFYSSAPGGGAVSDGSGGSAVANPSTSWQDPISGLMTTPPGQPESPNELAAVPDPVPAQAPAGYNAFINQKKHDTYIKDKQAREQPQPPPEMDPDAEVTPDQAMAEPQAVPAMEDYTGADLLKRTGGMGPPTFSDLRDRIKATQQRPAAPTPTEYHKSPQYTPEPEPEQQQAPTPQAQATPDTSPIQAAPTQAPQEVTPEEEEDQRKTQLMTALQNLVATPDKMKGAGANQLSREDAQAFMNFIEKGPQNQRIPLQDGELDYALSYLKDNYKDKWGSLQNRLKGKGDPEPSRKVVSRAREVLQSYLENLGQSAIDGSPLSFSESELDHRLSLDNGGLDQADNWDWLPRRFNQFKGALTNDNLMTKLKKRLEENPDDEALKEKVQELTRRQRGDWGQYFSDKGWSQLSQGDIRDQSGPLGMQFLKALAEKAGVSHYKDRGVTRESGRAGGGTSLAIDELKERLIGELGIPETQDVEAFDEDLVKIMQDLEDQRSDVDSANRKRKKERREEKKKSMKEGVFLTFQEWQSIMFE